MKISIAMKKSAISLTFFFLLNFCHITVHAQFELIETPTNNTISGIHCFDNFCVFSGSSDAFFKSYDLGESFIMLNSPTQIGKYDLVCIDSSVYFIAASSGPASPTANVFKTNDGGYTWDTLLDTMATYWAFDMANEHKGILVGGIQGSILQTNDGWETTTLQVFGASVYYFEVHFVDTSTIFRGRIGGISRSLDGGVSWHNVHGFSDMVSSHIYHFNEDLILSTANKSPGLGRIIRSTDGGSTWEKLFDKWSYRLNRILFVSENEGYVCGYQNIEKQGLLLYTYDGGETWNELLCGYDKTLYEIEQANDSILLIGGEDGLLLRFNRNQVTTGSREVANHQLAWRVFPNPANGAVTFSLHLPATTPISASLFDATGAFVRSVFVGTAGAGLFEHSFTVADLPVGLYLLKIMTTEGLLAQPVIKMKE